MIETINQMIEKLKNKTDVKSGIDLCYAVGYRNSKLGKEFKPFTPTNEFEEAYLKGRKEGIK